MSINCLSFYTHILNGSLIDFSIELREAYGGDQKNLFGLEIVAELKDAYHRKEVPVNMVSFVDTCLEGSIELADLFLHPFIMYDASGNKVSPVSSQRSLQNTESLGNSKQGNSFSSKNSVPAFLKKFLTNGSVTSTNRKSEVDNMGNFDSGKHNKVFYRHLSKASDYVKKDNNNNKHSMAIFLISRYCQ